MLVLDSSGEGTNFVLLKQKVIKWLGLFTPFSTHVRNHGGYLSLIEALFWGGLAPQIPMSVEDVFA